MQLVKPFFKFAIWTLLWIDIAATEIQSRQRSANARFFPTRLIQKCSSHLTTTVDNRDFNHEISDCFEVDTHLKKIENCLDRKSIRNVVKNLVLECYQVCPGEAYASYESYSKANESTVLVSTKTKKRSIQDIMKMPKKEKSAASKETVEAEEYETEMSEPSPAILSGIIQPLIPTNIWESLTGREFYFPSTLSGLIRAGINVCMPKSKDFVEWKAADSKTRKLLESSSDVHAVQNALREDDILVWVGKFKQGGHGSHLPLVKTVSILPISPRNMAALLMDSTKVTSYNKMSLGRNDEVVFQEGIDTEASSDESKLGIDGEAKIVRNLTKPPLSKKLMEFVTVMYARKLRSDDDVGPGVVGAPGVDGGYVVVSRAVNGGKWNPQSSSSGNEAERTRSEILLGVNLIRSIDGAPNKCEVTAVTHCNSPSVPTMLASSVGIKGAVDFIKDIRSLYSMSTL